MKDNSFINKIKLCRKLEVPIKEGFTTSRRTTVSSGRTACESAQCSAVFASWLESTATMTFLLVISSFRLVNSWSEHAFASFLSIRSVSILADSGLDNPSVGDLKRMRVPISFGQRLIGSLELLLAMNDTGRLWSEKSFLQEVMKSLRERKKGERRFKVGFAQLECGPHKLPL